MPLAEMIKSKFIPGLQSVVDLGCGWRGANDVIGHIPTRIGIEWSQKLLDRSAHHYTQTFCVDVRKWLADPALAQKADLYIMIDFLEHLSRPEGLELLWAIDKLATKEIVIFIPEGYCPAYPADEPGWQHEAEWFRDDFKNLGFQVEVLDKFHLGQYNALIAWKIKETQ